MTNEKKIEIAKNFQSFEIFFQENNCMNLLQICESYQLIKMCTFGKIF